MRLKNLHLINFKNYAAAEISFEGNVHCFLGRNGSGKTNLLEAIHYLSFTKGGTSLGDQASIRHSQQGFSIRGVFQKEKKDFEVTCTYAEDSKKKVAENGKDYKRFSEHFGKYPVVLVAPADIELIWDGAEIRRSFFDSLLSQLDKDYLEKLITYQHFLKNRNSLLRMAGERGSIDHDLVDSYNDKIAESGVIIFSKRSAFVKTYLKDLVNRYALMIEGESEVAGLTYQSEAAQLDFKSELTRRLDQDIAAGRTTFGVHRDDFHFTLNGFELKKYGSQGQQKSFLIALKLAEFDTLARKNNFKPILLLDDIFDKLDDHRINQLIRMVADGTFGQIFITDARAGRSLEILQNAGTLSQNFMINAGSVEPLS